MCVQILMLQLILVQNKLILNHLAEFSGPSVSDWIGTLCHSVQHGTKVEGGRGGQGRRKVGRGGGVNF